MKIITWVDLEGRYRVTSPAYNDVTRPSGESEADLLTRVWDKIKEHYSLPADHPFSLVNDNLQRAKLNSMAGLYFRYTADGSADGGAWEMDTDGRPKINMSKARSVHMGHIRKSRDAELVVLDAQSLRAIEDGDTSGQQRIAAEKQVLRDIPQTFDLNAAANPAALKATWPTELPNRT